MWKRNYYIVTKDYDGSINLTTKYMDKGEKEMYEDAPLLFGNRSIFITKYEDEAMIHKMKLEIEALNEKNRINDTKIENFNEKLNFHKNKILKQQRILENFKDGIITFLCNDDGTYFYKERKEYYIKDLILNGETKVYNEEENKVYLINMEEMEDKIIIKKIVVDIINKNYFVLEEKNIR